MSATEGYGRIKDVSIEGLLLRWPDGPDRTTTDAFNPWWPWRETLPMLQLMEREGLVRVAARGGGGAETWFTAKGRQESLRIKRDYQPEGVLWFDDLCRRLLEWLRGSDKRRFLDGFFEHAAGQDVHGETFGEDVVADAYQVMHEGDLLRETISDSRIRLRRAEVTRLGARALAWNGGSIEDFIDRQKMGAISVNDNRQFNTNYGQQGAAFTGDIHGNVAGVMTLNAAEQAKALEIIDAVLDQDEVGAHADLVESIAELREEIVAAKEPKQSLARRATDALVMASVKHVGSDPVGHLGRLVELLSSVVA
ncbi:hypothetical protein [Austwickia chelonae]|uniref:hypothetical protein n=1 Tax=Austwickia chelonae TaxID=100225 RepID=UPI000E239663|nr:hypothetical protein [Austwickia chelonae]